jgi:hypothetical protein
MIDFKEDDTKMRQIVSNVYSEGNELEERKKIFK